MSKKTKKQIAQIEEYKTDLREMLPPGSTVYTTVKHVSRSGMYCAIDVHAIVDNQPIRLSYRVAAILSWKFDEKRESVGVSGYGMDMGFHLVYVLSNCLYPDGFECIGEDCPSNDHFNGDRNYGPHTHSSGGYALRHRWI